ncbi:glycosylphosphatidylinositol anchor attachment 1 protein-like [Ptychodera flava]|uniref:glycosylphosphatidylinositol anchor attachment 1 protein-like n=1 Tax=Ptychodera flava TaxID=63121 RepID=UPI00396A5D26
MALLSDPKQREKLTRLIKKYYFKFSVLCYLAGIVWMLALAYKPLNAGTYFSENALLPGLVERQFYSDQDASEYVRQVLDAVKKEKAMPVDWLKENMQQLGLETYVQNFTAQHPFMGRTGKGKDAKPKSLSGQNVYGILRAPRIAGTEAVVFSIPFRRTRDSKKYGGTQHGIGLMLALAKFFRKQTYWSKDVIFLITEHESLGIQAWLESYHHVESEYIKSSLMHGRSGAILGAINLELGSSSVSHVDIKIEGLNGQLPNLDLVNLAVRLCKKERMPVTIQNMADPAPRDVENLIGFQQNAKIMLSNMVHQASGKPSGNHGLFHKYHIEAITLKGIDAKNKAQGFRVFGRVLEGIFRSLNNILERFHQSFFFYLLPSIDRYVSIGLYMPPFGLLVAVPAIYAIVLWIDMSSVSVMRDNDKSKEKEEKEEKKEMEGEKKTDENLKLATNIKAIPYTFSSVIPTALVAQFTGLLLYWSPETCGKWAQIFSIAPKEAVTIGITAYLLGASCLPYFTRRSITKADERTKEEFLCSWPLLKCLALIWHGVLMGGIAMMNFSLGYFLTMVTVPIFCLSRPTISKIGRFVQAILLLCVSPLMLAVWSGIIHTIWTSSGATGMDLFVEVMASSRTAMFDSVVDCYVYNNWLFPLASLLYFPNWLMFWCVLWQNP